MHTGADLLIGRQSQRLGALSAAAAHAEVEATWGIYGRMIAAYRDPDRTHGRATPSALIESLRTGVAPALGELVTLGRTLVERADDVLAHLDRPVTLKDPPRSATGD